MTSFWEILKSSKNLKASDAFAELWGKSIADSWDIITITGTLPLTFEAKGEALKNYLLHGSSEGAGVRTENLFDLSSYYEVSSLISDIIIEKNRITYNASGRYLAIKYKFNLGIADVYTISLGADSLNTRLEIRYAKNGEYVGRAIIISPNQKTTVRGGNEYDGFYVFISNFTNTGICTASNIMLNLGSTAPTSYIPYGYQIPLTVTSGETENLYDILFIGDSKLGAEEYVDYQEQKVWKMVDGTLTPTDPPAPLPAIQTYKGENTLSSTETVGEVSVTGKIKEI